MQKKAAQQKPEKRARIKDQDQTGMQRMIRQYLIKNIAAKNMGSGMIADPGQQLRFLAEISPFSSAWTDTAVPIGKPHKNPARRQKLHAGDKCRHFLHNGPCQTADAGQGIDRHDQLQNQCKGKKNGQYLIKPQYKTC